MSDKNSENRLLTFTSIWEDFVETTGFHAVNKIHFRKQPIFRTMFWILLWMVSAGYLMYIVSNELIHYYQYPTITTVTSRISDELEFPAVTICNLASRNSSKFIKDDRVDNYYIGVSGMYKFRKAINWSDPFYALNGFLTNRTMQDLFEESKNLSHFTYYHTFDLKDNYLNFTPVATDLGLCYRTSTTMTSLYGGLYNLNVYLDLLLEDDYYSNTYISSGLKIAVHDKNQEVLMINQGFVVSPATEAFVEISRKHYKYLPLPYKAFEDDVCEIRTTDYRVSKCRKGCLRQTFLQKCGCVDFSFESENGTYCSKQMYIECIFPTFWQFFSSKTSSCLCPISCEYTKYDTSVTFAHFPSDLMMKPLTLMMNKTEEYIKRNYISLRIFYKDLQTLMTEQVPKYSNVGEVFSNVGGQMGLFLGASILTVTELCEFLLFVIWYFFLKMYKRTMKVNAGKSFKTESK